MNEPLPRKIVDKSRNYETYRASIRETPLPHRCLQQQQRYKRALGAHRVGFGSASQHATRQSPTQHSLVSQGPPRALQHESVQRHADPCCIHARWWTPLKQQTPSVTPVRRAVRHKAETDALRSTCTALLLRVFDLTL